MYLLLPSFVQDGFDEQEHLEAQAELWLGWSSWRRWGLDALLKGTSVLVTRTGQEELVILFPLLDVSCQSGD